MMSALQWGLKSCLAMGLVAASYLGANAVEPAAPERLIDREFVTLIAVRNELNAPGEDLSFAKSRLDGLKAYYGADNARLVWIDNEGLNETAAAELKDVFEDADAFGLNSSHYALPPVAQGTSVDALARTELLFSVAAMEYADDAQAGRFDPTSLSKKFIDLHPAKPEVSAVLTGLAGAGNEFAQHLESFHPTHPQFHALKVKLAEIRTAENSGTAPIRIPDGPSLGSNTYHPHIEIVRQRLKIDPPDYSDRDNAVQYYDEELEAAVRAYQEEKGLKPDGIIGRRTREALNEGTIPVSAETIVSNMERWRWAPREFGQRHVFINVPEFKFRVMNGERIIHQERLVTGSPKHKTPLFSDEMETIVFNPYWNVPRSILVNEIIPAQRRNPGYIDRNNMEVIWQGRRTVDPYQVDWYQVNPNKVFLRQVPGSGNALGRVKFLFPNKHAVYMHDTPSKHLFNKPVRAYSHGCMRVRDPLKFAELLLADQGWSQSRIDRALATGYDQHVRLEKKLPVHVSYFTAWVDEDGQIHGYSDVYGYDRQVRLALNLDTRGKKIAANVEEEFEIGEGGLRN